LIIAIPFSGKDVSTEVAGVMIASCRRVMPDVPIWQLTDEITEQLPGVDKAVRRPRGDDWGEFFLDHMIDLPEVEILRIDYDVIVQRDVSGVFAMPFDLALTRRPLNDVTCSNSVRTRNPHNHGVMFLRRARRFFEEAKKQYAEGDGWMDIAMALEAAACVPDIRWVELPGERYNFTPKRKTDDVSACSIVHYKGDRKWWMVDVESARRDGARILEMVEKA
jgi:hypothetical protein